MYTYKPERCKVPIKIWEKAGGIEEEALEQIENAASLPFAYHHMALMPDGHQGYGAPIGGVLASEGIVVPNFVGVDIGCGMCAVKTSLKVERLNSDTLKKIMGKIREIIPVGFNHHKENQDESLMPQKTPIGICNEEYSSALKQLGTLGGGNHFIEIQKDNENNVWIMIHSGSRNLGKKVADYYNKLAIGLNEKWFSQVSKKQELAFLPIETREAKNYMLEMQYCVDFALANRKLMMVRIGKIFEETFPGEVLYESIIQGEIPLINIAHNYAQWEHHFGKDVIIHRKGATLAREGTIGIIPGSQGSKSYIVKGLGNPDSFDSCSHGAGRKMGRKEACRSLNLEEEIKKLDDQGIVHGIRTQNDLEEAPGAYKNIDEVMANQNDLVEILVELLPLAVIKG